MKKLFKILPYYLLALTFLGAVPEDVYITMVTAREAHVANASEITDPSVTHQSVIERAIESLPRSLSQADLGGSSGGQWDNGTVVFGQGPYHVTDQIYIPARVNLIGTYGAHRPHQAGTYFKVITGGDLTGVSADLKYVFRSAKSDGKNYNGNFNQHWENFGIDCSGYSRGLLVSGAQCSSVKKVGVINCKDVGIYAAGGRPILLQGVEVANVTASSLLDSIALLSEAERIQFLNCSFSTSDIGLKAQGIGTISISGIVFENVRKLIIEKTSAWGILTGDGISIQGGANLTAPYAAASAGERLILKSPVESTIRLTGTIRSSSGPKIWDLGGVAHVIRGATTNNNRQYPFILTDDGYASVVEN